MAAKKNKKAKKPAVGKSAAGSNNKRDKNKSQKPENTNNKKTSGKNSAAQSTKKKSAKTVNNGSKKAVPKKEKNIRNSAKKKNVSPKEKKNIQKNFIKKIKESEQNTAASFEEFKKEYNIRKIAMVLALAAVLVAGIIFASAALLNRNATVPDYVKDAEFKGRTEPESIAFKMDISENQQKALAKATKAKGNRRAFSFFVNDSIVMDDYDEPALIEFGSVDSNDCVLVFFLLDENGNEIYRSLGIEPGEQVKSVNFFDEISYGSHELTIAVVGYDAETYENTGMQTAKINLEIGVN